MSPTIDWVRALAECAHVMRELHEVREAGFTEEALRYPRGLFSLRLLCAFNGAPAGWMPPRGWRYYPNRRALSAWAEVMVVAEEGGSPLDLARAHAPCIVGFANEPMRKAWERVHAADWEWREAA